MSDNEALVNTFSTHGQREQTDVNERMGLYFSKCKYRQGHLCCRDLSI